MYQRKNWQDNDGFTTAIIAEAGDTEQDVVDHAIECLVGLSHIEDLIKENRHYGREEHFTVEIKDRGYDGKQSALKLEYTIKVTIYFEESNRGEE